MIPRLLAILQQPTAGHISRRAAQVLLNLAGAPGNHDAFRQYEWAMAFLALHSHSDTGSIVAPIIADVLSELAS